MGGSTKLQQIRKEEGPRRPTTEDSCAWPPREGGDHNHKERPNSKSVSDAVDGPAAPVDGAPCARVAVVRAVVAVVRRGPLAPKAEHAADALAQRLVGRVAAPALAGDVVRRCIAGPRLALQERKGEGMKSARRTVRSRSVDGLTRRRRLPEL